MKLMPFGANMTIIIIEDATFYFSYNTCVAISNKDGDFRIKSPSVTTTKHMNKMGVIDFSLVSEKELAHYIPTTRLPPLQVGE